MYHDDILYEFDTLQSALELKAKLITLLTHGDFDLRKWVANDTALLSHISYSYSQIDVVSLDIESDTIIEILGLQSNPSYDNFTFSVTHVVHCCTKRSLLSPMSHILDLLGFLTPVTLSLKLIVQSLWSLVVGWDDPVP